MRKSFSVLALLASIAVPFTVEGAPHRPPRGRTFQQKMPSFKKAKVQPNDPELVAAQGLALGKLKADLDAVPLGPASREQGAALQQSLLAVVDGSTRPKAESVKPLATHLAEALAKRGGTFDTIPLARDLKVVMNAAYRPPVNVDQALKDSLDRLKTAGVDEAGSQAIAHDLRAIVAELKTGGGAGLIK